MFAKKHRFRIFALIMSAILAFLMVGVISFISTGFDTGYLLRSGRAFSRSRCANRILLLGASHHCRAALAGMASGARSFTPGWFRPRRWY
jgi:hypothetical protein